MLVDPFEDLGGAEALLALSLEEFLKGRLGKVFQVCFGHCVTASPEVVQLLAVASLAAVLTVCLQVASWKDQHQYRVVLQPVCHLSVNAMMMARQIPAGC